MEELMLDINELFKEIELLKNKNYSQDKILKMLEEMKDSVSKPSDEEKMKNKLEHFACVAMNGLLANGSIRRITSQETASLSIEIAEALINELDKRGGKL